jgi:hypothetical protein
MWTDIVNAARALFIFLAALAVLLGFVRDSYELKLIGVAICMAVIVSAIHRGLFNRRR